jgi:hypothetical protein
MEFYRVFFPTPDIYANIRQMAYKEYQAMLPEWRAEALKQLAETGADHVIYGSRIYNEDGTVKEMNMYMIPLDDAEFYRRTNGVDDLVLAVHRMK